MARPYLVVAVAVMCAAACTSGPNTPAPAGPASVPSPGPPLIPPTGGHPSPEPTTTPPPTTGGCPARADVQIRPGAVPAAICLPLNGVLAVTAPPSPRQPWGPLASSDDSVLRCASQPRADGSISGTCTALHPGTATISTVTAPFAGDPGGPPQVRWQIEITVHGAA